MTEFQPLANTRVMIVDDQPAARSLIRALLSSLSIYSVYEACDGFAAMEALQSQTFDLIISDLSMKPMDGLQLTRSLRKPGTGKPGLPVLILSSHSEESMVKAAIEAGASDYLTKPISRARLEAKIRSVLTAHRAIVQGPDYWGPDRRRQNRWNRVMRRAGDRTPVEL